MNLLQLLTPDAEETARLAKRETNPKLAPHFEPLAIGPLATIIMLGFIGIAAIAVAPFRILITLTKRRRM